MRSSASYGLLFVGCCSQSASLLISMRSSASYGLLFVGCSLEERIDLDLDAQQRILPERTILDLDAQQRILRFALCRMLLEERIMILILDAQQRILPLCRAHRILILMRSSASYQSASFLNSMRSSASYLS
jgi:hypothetical protein